VTGVLLAFVALLLAEAPGATPPPSKAADRCHFDPDKIDVQRDIVAPKKVKHVPPVYPQAAKESGKSGTVVVEVVLSPSGKPVKTSIKTSIDPDLDRAAMEAVQQWEYTPTLVLGQACPTVLDVSVRFTLDEPRSDAAPSWMTAPHPASPSASAVFVSPCPHRENMGRARCIFPPVTWPFISTGSWWGRRPMASSAPDRRSSTRAI